MRAEAKRPRSTAEHEGHNGNKRTTSSLLKKGSTASNKKDQAPRKNPAMCVFFEHATCWNMLQFSHDNNVVMLCPVVCIFTCCASDVDGRLEIDGRLNHHHLHPPFIRALWAPDCMEFMVNVSAVYTQFRSTQMMQLDPGSVCTSMRVKQPTSRGG